MGFELTPRERRWLDVVLILAAIALAFVVLGFLANLLAAFGDIILVFFLAWLLAFILDAARQPRRRRSHTSPGPGGRGRLHPAVRRDRLPVVGVAGALAASVTDFIANVPQLRSDLPSIVAPWQERLNSLG